MQIHRGKTVSSLHPGGVWTVSSLSKQHYERAGHFITGGCDGRLRTWRLSSFTKSRRNAHDVRNENEDVGADDAEIFGSCVQTFSKHSLPVVSVSTSSDGDTAVSTSLDGTIKVWCVGSDSPEPKAVQNTSAHDVWTAVVSRDGERALSGGANGCVMIIDCTVCMVDQVHTISKKQINAKGENRHVVARKDGSMILSLALNEDETSAAIGSADGSVFEIDMETGKILSSSCTKHAGPVRSVRYISDERKTLLSASDDGLVKVHDLNSGDTTAALSGHDGMVLSAESCFEKGRLIASGGSDCFVKIWDRSKQSPLFSSALHSGAVWGVSWVEGCHVVSVSDDGNIALISCLCSDGEQL